MIAAEAAEVADRVRNEVAVERGDAFRRLLTMIIATRVASGLVEVLHSMNLLLGLGWRLECWNYKATVGQVSWRPGSPQCPPSESGRQGYGGYGMGIIGLSGNKGKTRYFW